MKKLFCLFITAVLCIVMCVPASALRVNTVIDTSTLNKMMTDYRTALKAGETYVDLSKYGVSGTAARWELLEFLLNVNGEIGCLSFGKYSETFVSTDIDYNTSTGAIKGASIKYPERYRKADGKCDTELVKQDQKLITDRYNYAKSLTKRNMRDAEKALVLFDYIVTAANYAENNSLSGSGDSSLIDDIHTVYGFLRDEQAVCSAYAKLYAILLNEAGLKAVTVHSDVMDHEWVMVNVDGEWYHCDPTWADPMYDDHYTALGHKNNDLWDIGSVDHRYFLKSDEEFTELQYHDWDISNNVNPDFLTEAPVSGASGAFDDKFFSDQNPQFFCISAMNYINGSWYFADLDSSSIICTDYDTVTDSFQLPNKERPAYSFGYENELYICSDKSVFRYDPIGGSCDKIIEIPADKRNSDSFSEFLIMYGEMTLITVSYDNAADIDSSDCTFTVDKRSMEDVDRLEPIYDEFSDNGEDSEAAIRDPDMQSDKVTVTRPGSVNGNRELSAAEKEILEKAEATGKRMKAFIFLGLGVVFIIIAIVSVILVIKNSKKR